MFGNVRADMMPYCVKQVRKNRYVFLNREYKPIGVVTDAYVDYADYAFEIKGLTPARAAKASVHGSSDRTAIYFYDDGCKPESSAANAMAYFKRIGAILDLKTKPIGAACSTPWPASTTHSQSRAANPHCNALPLCRGHRRK